MVVATECGGYEVTVTATETVAVALPVQEHRLPMSNLDLLLPPLDVGVFFCYDRQPSKGSPVAALKAGLARVLTAYYPLAGEVVSNAAGEPELLCSNRGVDFVEARAACTDLRELRLGEPGESVDGKLLPKKKPGVMCVQATEFKCGGLVVGCTFDHRVADAYSFNMFLEAWAAAARSTAAADEDVDSPPPPPPPSFRRSLLAPRRPPPPVLDPVADRFFVRLRSVPPPPSGAAAAAAPISRIYHVAAADIAALQSAAGPGRTKLEALTAHLWRVLAEAAAPHQTSCCMGVVVDGRARLLRAGAPMQSYFGNVLSIPYGTLDTARLRGMPLSDVADDVHAWVSAAATAEHFRSLVDWVEAVRPEPAAARAYLPGDDTTACVVSSGMRFPAAGVDFGWGRPAFWSYHFPWGGAAGYVMPMPSARGDGDWIVYVHVAPQVAMAIEEDPTLLFKTLDTSDALGEAICKK